MSMESVQQTNGSKDLAKPPAPSPMAGFRGGTDTGFGVMDMQQLWWLCGQLVGTGFLPKAVTTPGQAMAIVLAGRELGFELMQSLRVIHVIEGRVTLSAEAQLALMLKAGMTFRWLASTDKIATLEATRRGMDPLTISWTIEQAQRAGLAGKDNWKKHTEAMLRARTITAVGRALAADILGNLFDPDEAIEAEVVAARTIAAPEAQPATKTESAKQKAKKALAPAQPPTIVEPPREPTPEEQRLIAQAEASQEPPAA